MKDTPKLVPLKKGSAFGEDEINPFDSHCANDCLTLPDLAELTLIDIVVHMTVVE